MGREQELENVSAAFFLESRIHEYQQDRAKLLDRKPLQPQKPEPPELKIPTVEPPDYPIPSPSKRVYPPPLLLGVVLVSITCFSSLMPKRNFPFLLLVCAVPLIIWGLRIKKEKESKLTEINRNSTVYIERCRTMDSDHKQKQKLATEKARSIFDEKHRYYIENVLPAYNAELAIYLERDLPEWEEELACLDIALHEAKMALDEIYSVDLIPGKYRNLSAVSFICSLMGTSHFDMKFAIERYDMTIEHELNRLGNNIALAQFSVLQSILSETKYANYLHEESLYEIQEANKTLTGIKRWTAANTAMHAYDIYKQRKQERKR